VFHEQVGADTIGYDYTLVFGVQQVNAETAIEAIWVQRESGINMRKT
jgi:hypothetical protein